MNKKNLIRSFILVTTFQLVILVGEYFSSVYPLWTGKPAILAIVPLDLRSLFSGNYIHLDYDITNLDERVIDGTLNLRTGAVVYVHLTEHSGVFRAQYVTAKAPEKGPFIRGRVRHFYREDQTISLSIHYGIEAYFFPKEKALAIEEKFRDGQQDDSALAYAQVRIASSGKAALENIIWELP